MVPKFWVIKTKCSSETRCTLQFKFAIYRDARIKQISNDFDHYENLIDAFCFYQNFVNLLKTCYWHFIVAAEWVSEWVSEYVNECEGVSEYVNWCEGVNERE